MAINIGQAVGNYLGFDPTPGFNVAAGSGGMPYAAATSSRNALGQGGNTRNFNDGAMANFLAGSKATPTSTPQTQQNLIASDNRYQGGQQAAQDAQGQADTIASYDDQSNQLRGLLGRTERGLADGLTQLEDDYQGEVGFQGGQQERANAGYTDQRNTNTQTKQTNYDTINKGGNRGYRSLASIIGRASGTGSSAFRDMLPNVVGQDMSGKRSAANETYGKNAQGIDKAQGETELSFANILADLAKQRKKGEGDLRTDIATQQQDINGQLANVAGQRAVAAGGGYAQAKAAADPYQRAITNSQNTVEGYFNQYRTPYQRTAATVATPELSQYTADRSNINNGGQNPVDSNPYAELLKRKQQEGQVA